MIDTIGALVPWLLCVIGILLASETFFNYVRHQHGWPHRKKVIEPWKIAMPQPLTAEGTFKFLCPPDTSSDVKTLCGMVMEMTAVLLFETSAAFMSRQGNKAELTAKDQERLFGRPFEKLGQERRINVLFALDRIDVSMKADFEVVRDYRNRYLHLFSKQHEELNKDAIDAFTRTVAVVKATLGLDVNEKGQVVFNPEILRYIESGA